MDGSRFDQLTRALGHGTSRRAALKAALGLGGAALAGDQLLADAQAARRPTPTPKPVTCPGVQHWDGAACVCPNGSDKCGPDCCPAGAECCDNACCYGTCYGEELCCPSGSFVCNGVCIPFFEGACCSNTDCGPNQECAAGECIDLCIPDGGTGCGDNADCCTGICQGEQCVATVGGTCSAGYDTCSGSGFEACGNDHGCKCALSLFDEIVCAGDWTCTSSCDACGLAGGYCAAGGQCCGAESFTCYFRCGPDGGNICFTAETRIAMADGTSCSIADIRVGDLVLGDDGTVNRVAGIDTPYLGDRLLYGFNGERAFVTASHPFQTDDGWKAVDPANTYRDHLLPAVGRLEIGDRLVQLSGVLVPAGAAHAGAGSAVEIRSEPLALARIEEAYADPSTRLYNLRLDGNHTYFANDLLVHNK